MTKPNLIICLMGPTASGKTDLAVELVQRLPCAIISVDSAMVYRGMDIGTAKPDADLLQRAPHRLIDICDPAEAYSAGQFCADAIHEIQSISAQGAIPLLVGGTMLYFHALQRGMAELPTANPLIRSRLQLEAEKYGAEAMYERLRVIDPLAAERIHPHDPQRVQRALEVFEITGKPLSSFFQQQNTLLTNYQFLNIAVAPRERTTLHERIAKRFQQMLAQGFEAEVAALFQRADLTIDMPSMRAVGYRQMWQYLEGKLTYAEMCEKGIVATRQLAKRQFTWLRSWQDMHWFDSENKLLVVKILKAITSSLEKIY